MEGYKYFLCGYLWIFLMLFQQDIWRARAEETYYKFTSTVPLQPTMQPRAKEITRKPFTTTQQAQIPQTSKTYYVPKRVTAPPLKTKRITTKKLLKTTKKPITTKNRVTTPKILPTTKKAASVTRNPIINTTDVSAHPVTSQPEDPVGSDGVQVIYHCSFEMNENCRFLQDTRDELDWRVERDPSPSSTSNGEGQAIGPAQLKQKPPSGKHNFDMSFGRFAHLSPKTLTGKGTARIATPEIAAPDEYVDLSFLYHIFNANPELLEGILNVLACNNELVWTSSASWGNHWFKANVRITCNDGFRIIFEGVIGGLHIDIAIDDVAVTGPHKPETVPTTLLLTTEDLTTWETEEPDTSTTPMVDVSGPLTPGGNDTDIGTDHKIDPGTAVSLVTVSVALFITTVVMLMVSLVIHARVCAKRSRYPAHIIYHGPEYFNRGTDGDPTAYMTLNFKDGVSSRSGTGTEVLTLSDRHSGPTPIDRSSWEQVIMRDMKPVRRESKTFPIMKEIKHLLEAVHMRRIRTLSAHLSRAEVETLRRQFTPDTTQDGTQENGTHERTRSTVVLERTGSSIRPLSEISEHFYYSLFPDPRTRPDLIRPDSGMSGLSQFNNGFDNENSKDGEPGSRPGSTRRHRSLRTMYSRPFSSPALSPRSLSVSGPRKESSDSSPETAHGRERSRGQQRLRAASPVEDIEIVDETKEEEEEEGSTVNGHGADADAESLAPETTEMVENEIYEPYSGDVESDAQ